jgi:hypothetical protein
MSVPGRALAKSDSLEILSPLDIDTWPERRRLHEIMPERVTSWRALAVKYATLPFPKLRQWAKDANLWAGWNYALDQAWILRHLQWYLSDRKNAVNSRCGLRR